MQRFRTSPEKLGVRDAAELRRLAQARDEGAAARARQAAEQHALAMRSHMHESMAQTKELGLSVSVAARGQFIGLQDLWLSGLSQLSFFQHSLHSTSPQPRKQNQQKRRGMQCIQVLDFVLPRRKRARLRSRWSLLLVLAHQC